MRKKKLRATVYPEEHTKKEEQGLKIMFMRKNKENTTIFPSFFLESKYLVEEKLILRQNNYPL